MQNSKRIIVITSIALSIIIVIGALVVLQSRKNAATSGGSSQNSERRTVSKTELAAATGKDGKACYVAVDNTVYEIKDFSLWQNGEHKPSNGEAYCGADMTASIDKSPHGRRMLDLLVTIGPLGT